MLANHFEHYLDVHWLILILKQYTFKHIFSFSFYHSRLYTESCLEICWFLDANQSWILLTEKKQHLLCWKGAQKLASAPSVHLTSYTEVQREEKVVSSGSKADWRSGQKWNRWTPFPLNVFKVAFKFRLGSQSVLTLIGCYFWFAFHALRQSLSKVMSVWGIFFQEWWWIGIKPIIIIFLLHLLGRGTAFE